MKKGKLIIFTAPSGAGKTTIVKHLLDQFPELSFSISACTREARYGEVNGMDYYFLNVKDFMQRVKNDEFLEWEEVYDDQYYGTLRSEVERIWSLGKHVIFDIDVKGASKIKKAYPEDSLAIFVKPPSKEILIKRLKQRKTEDKKSLKKRIARAKEELTYEARFDEVLVNDKLEKAFKQACKLVKSFIEK